MAINKGLAPGSAAMLILKLLEDRDLYGYGMIEELARRSDNTFSLKAGTLYPLLHGLERDGVVTSYEQSAEGERMRNYYRLTPKGRTLLQQKQEEWRTYAGAVDRVLKGGACCVVC